MFSTDGGSCRWCRAAYLLWVADQGELAELDAADPERVPGHDYATESEARARLDELAPIVVRNQPAETMRG